MNVDHHSISCVSGLVLGPARCDAVFDEWPSRPTVSVVFLDIDGVMNSERSARRFRTFHRAEPDSVEALNLILAVDGASIVVSSTWRTIHSLDYLRGWLEGQGVRRGRVVGRTCEAWDRPDCQRGRISEIEHWLATFKPGGLPFVILDDEWDMSPHGARFVQTDMAVGLTLGDARRAVAILRPDPKIPSENHPVL